MHTKHPLGSVTLLEKSGGGHRGLSIAALREVAPARHRRVSHAPERERNARRTLRQHSVNLRDVRQLAAPTDSRTWRSEGEEVSGSEIGDRSTARAIE